MSLSSSPSRTDIVIPGEDYVLLNWKVKAGNHVQKGEAIAVACHKDDHAFLSTSMQNKSQGTTTSTHKRPRRGRKLNLLTPTKAINETTKTNTTVSSLDTSTLHKKLAEKLSKSVQQQQQQKANTDDNTVSETSKKTRETKSILSPAKGFLRIPESSSLNSQTIIGYIEECLHPTFFEGLCVICGTSKLDVVTSNNPGSGNDVKGPLDNTINNGSNNNDNSSVPKSTLVTVSGGITMSISHQESQQMAFRDSERLLKKKKLSLVLDLDHTLVHATSDPRARQHLASNLGTVRTLRLPVVLETPPGIQAPPPPPQQQMWMTHYVKLRPHLKEFMENVQPYYELTVYTAGTRQYAEEITIVICRHLVGSNRDTEGLEQLRYETSLIETEYNQRLASMQDTKKRKVTELSIAKDDETSEIVDEATEEPAKKKKKVSFGATHVKTFDKTIQGIYNDDPEMEKKRLEQIKERLENLQNELKQAEELEKKAWEMRQEVFGSRVVSRTDVGDLGRDVKSLKRIFPCGGTMAAVVDDREDVWANAQDNSVTIKGEPPENLLLVRPYHWKTFVGFADVNNAAGVDLSGQAAGRDSETDVQLLWTSKILKDLHTRYYEQSMTSTNGGLGRPKKSVPELLSKMRRSVLKGSTLVLSGLVPLHKKTIGADMARPPIVRYAQSLGANLQDTVQLGVTHVIAAKDGTDKALAARKTPRCSLVKAAWLVECYWSMTRRDLIPHLFPGSRNVETDNSHKPVEPLKETKMEDNSSSESDSDDDDLAAEFEAELMNS